MSYAQVAQHHKDNNAQKEKQQKNEKQVNEQQVAPASNGKHASSASGRTANDSRDSRGELDSLFCVFFFCT